MANRAPGDAILLSALGDLLRKDGRIITGHLCQLFISDGFCSGVDSHTATVVLLGADHRRNPKTFYRDIQAFSLTEIYEYSQTLINSAGYSNCIPHFLAYKVVYISYLIDLGHFEIASAYLESVETFIKNYNKGSPYLHQKLLETTKMLADMVIGRQPSKTENGKESTGGWLSKVSGFDSFSIMGVLDRGINTLMTNAAGLESEPAKKSPLKTQVQVLAPPVVVQKADSFNGDNMNYHSAPITPIISNRNSMNAKTDSRTLRQQVTSNAYMNRPPIAPQPTFQQSYEPQSQNNSNQYSNSNQYQPQTNDNQSYQTQNNQNSYDPYPSQTFTEYNYQNNNDYNINQSGESFGYNGYNPISQQFAQDYSQNNASGDIGTLKDLPEEDFGFGNKKLTQTLVQNAASVQNAPEVKSAPVKDEKKVEADKTGIL